MQTVKNGFYVTFSRHPETLNVKEIISEPTKVSLGDDKVYVCVCIPILLVSLKSASGSVYGLSSSSS